MDRANEIKKIMLILKKYWMEHPNVNLGKLISQISSDTTKNFDPIYLTYEKLYSFLVENTKDED